MEPDIIRMYSSSPPPLDNGADDDDEDEFGEFGGFSGVSTAGVAFADFDAADYSHPKEEFIPTNHFIPLHDYSDNVASIATFTSVKNVKDCIAELPTSPKELSDALATSTSKEKSKFRTSGTAFDVSLEDVNKKGEQRENTGKSEGFSSDVRTDITVESQDEQIDACNGEKLPCLEILTNGFAALDPVNPQGTEDLDNISDSKGLKTVSSYSTELRLNSIPSSGEGFADFATFSNRKTINVGGTGPTICTVLSERDSLNIQENNRINRAVHTEEETCTAEVSCEQDSSALEGNQFTISSTFQTTGSSICTTENGENNGRRKQRDEENGKDFSQLDGFSGTEDVKIGEVETLSTDLQGENVGDSEEVKNGGSSAEVVACCITHDDDFGDFGSVSSASSAFINAQESTNASALEGTSEQPALVSQRNDAFGEFRDISTVSQLPAELDQANLNQTADTLECDATSKTSGLDFQHTTEVENGDDSEFGDFDSVPKSQDESLAFQDSDDFADFSSAGCNQATDWNAFEDEEKDSCSWAAFGDEQAGESHHRKETRQSHRTDTSARSDGPVLHKTDSFASVSFQGTTSKQSQEPAPSVQTTLLCRLERIFEVCFPSMPVLEIEKEITSLNRLLEAGEKQTATEETLANTGELRDVWTELQDIHDAYGLRYQWGGSHSNKKLLCSLGIDTRNILFTGNKKQPVIVPMYAAGLGMLEPTKEPLKPISAAEKIASIGQTPPVSPEMNTCASDQFQESLPPVQFDWSSSGLTNPLDASGGSTLLNLDFFGPVDDSSSNSTTTIPGVDPELYELTTSKLETSNASSRVTDAFARLMSTVEKASTSTRKPKKEEHLSEEAAKVISSLPDLTFMHAKVLMFPATLTPSTSCQEKVD
ncbi:aftiphilin isoform X1 [Centrocercus urophasianus]|uniref:aftiphilin isoform X1 n=1 Tax=Centrocercus urophasianus TaxID=9002 RepID=UPI001C64ABCB|nr:aftiphilin isoform X1 [Centrocercus urophasianus]XP_042690128.1 aftiphilin isoform X1 [Centrocercus urophasianus]XP_042690204.1 aftiphilin isoform X1 [Centrocercus urophasianus]